MNDVRLALPNRRLGFQWLACATCAILAVSSTAQARGGPSQLIRNLRAGMSQRVVVYGTSLTFSGAWPEQLNEWLAGEYAGQLELINAGIPSGSSQNVNPVLDGLGRLDARVLSKDPDTVFLEFAVNDALVGNNISVAQSRANLGTMIDRILRDRPGREVIVMTMNPAWDPPGQFAAGSARPNLAAYYQAYRDVAGERGLLLVDHYDNWLRLRAADEALFEQFVPDGVHPTVAAQAQIVTPAIIRVLTAPEPGTMWHLLAAMSAVAVGRFRQHVDRDRKTGNR